MSAETTTTSPGSCAGGAASHLFSTCKRGACVRRCNSASIATCSARTRHVEALRRTAAHLEAATRHAASGDAALELFAEELRLAHDALGEITGAFTTDDLLGEIFGRFCIGK